MEIRYPDFTKRVQSLFIDGMMMVLLMILTAWLLDKLGLNEDEESGWARALIFVLIWGVYEPLATSLGYTAGNYFMKIRVRKNSDTTKKINILQAYLRFIIKFFLGWLSFITIHFTEKRRAIHDLVAGTVVIEYQQ